MVFLALLSGSMCKNELSTSLGFSFFFPLSLSLSLSLSCTISVREYGFLYLFCVYQKKFEKETAGFMNCGGGYAVLAN
jgi:hypothetical protein